MEAAEIDYAGYGAMLELILELVFSLVGMFIELVFMLLVKVPGFVVDLVLKPGKEAQANKWQLAIVGIIFYGLIIGPILLVVIF